MHTRQEYLLQQMNIEYINRFANDIWYVYSKNLPVNDFELDIYFKIVRRIRENPNQTQTQFDDEKTRSNFIRLLQLMRHTISNVKYPYTDMDDVNISDDDELYCCLRIEDDLRQHRAKL